MNSTISLDPRIFDNGLKTPIAPPRKKRSTLKKGATLPTTTTTSLNDDKNEKIIRNGFKDVFVNGNESQSHSLPYDKKESELTQSTRSLERTMKVGNKKSDRILGENLSDHLSIEPIDDLNKTNEVVEKLASMPSDKKLFFLMNMLEQSNNDDDEIYKNRIPIEEPTCIERKKIKKHCCDDDDFDPSHFHKHEKESHEPPKKPERDFTKYQKTEDIDVTEKSENVKKSLSRENLPTPPEVPPQRKTGANNSINTPIIKIDDGSSTSVEVENKIDVKIVENVKKSSSPKQLKRPPSLNLTKAFEDSEIHREDAPQTAPILTHVIVDEMIKKSYGLQDYHPEDFEMNNQDDGSNLVAPKSKLTVRKVSVGRKISSCSTPSLDACDSVNESLSPGGSTSKLNETEQPKSPTKFYNQQSMSDVIEEIYSKNSEVMKEFQTYLEASIAKNPTVDVDKEKAYIEEKNIKINDDDENSFVTRDDVTADENKKKDDDDEIEGRHYSDSFESSDEDEQQETIKEMAKFRNKFPKYHSARRESIEDVDTWFSHHLDIDEKKSNYENKFEVEPSPTTYDTHKTFPFGRTISLEERRESMSDEFFSDLAIFKKTKQRSSDSIAEEELNQSINENNEQKIREIREKSPDHSTLLKILNEKN